MADPTIQGADLETRDDAGPSAQEQAAFWRGEIDRAGKYEKKWRERAKKVVQQYRADGRAGDKASKSEFNILWSNTETLKPALYSATPIPDVRRRYRDEDEVGREVAKVLERGLSFQIDVYDFDGTIINVIEDYLLVGRGVARNRYIPTINVIEPERVTVIAESGVDEATGEFVERRMTEDGEPVDADVEVQEDDDGFFIMSERIEEVVWEGSRCEYVLWTNFRQSSEPQWRDKRWVAFGSEMTRDELVEAFGDKGHLVTLSGPDGEDIEPDEDGDSAALKTAFVWEVWDRVDKRVRFVSDGYKDGFLADIDDPLNLVGFFPMPEPMISVKTNDSSIPIPEYTLYQDLAQELNTVTDRISKLVGALRVRGIYDAQFETWMSQLFASSDTALIPADGFQAFMEKGGVEGAISWAPVEQIGKVLVGLYNQRQQIINAIYEITGISDIMRGSTDPRETAKAQQLKGQFGSMRIKPRQQQVQRFVRDIFRIKAEIMAELFEPETLSAMTGTEVTPEMVAVMRDDALRTYRVDIETDSTVAPDEQKDKQDVTELFTALGGFLQSVGPLVQEGAIPKDSAMAILRWGMRRFKVSRDIEQMLEPPPEGQGEQEQEQPDPEAMKAQADIQARQAEVQAEIQRKAQESQAKLQMEQAEMQAEQKRKDAETQQRLAIEREEFEREQRRKDALNQARIAGEQTRAAATSSAERRTQ